MTGVVGPPPAALSPALENLLRVLALLDYNTRLVVLTTALLGLASGLVGTFLLLRRRSLMGDALSHATLPGVGLAFLLAVAAGSSGKSLPVLLLGAAVTGLLGTLLVLLIRNHSRLKDDAAMGIVLGVSFGVGIAVLGVAQDAGGSAAGLEGFIYGKTASLVRSDLFLLAGTAFLVLACVLALRKEFTLLCFDEAFGSARGFPARRLDALLLTLATLVTIAGLQAVGLILVVAFLILPAAAARFWTHRVGPMLGLAAGIGALSGWSGASVSALFGRLPAGAVIVLAASCFFTVSLFFGRARGLAYRWYQHRLFERKMDRQHFLRAAYECLEGCYGRDHRGGLPPNRPLPVRALRANRGWSEAEWRRMLRQARREDHLERVDRGHLLLSEAGYGEAARVVRNHRLWELFLMKHAAIAASHVHRDADAVEHLLSPEMVDELERELDRRDIPGSPHPLPTVGAEARADPPALPR